MLEKVKSYFIILLILSLSFVPSVNASSDIFDEPRHVDYETYKQRMVEYIETPDYLKASMPPIVGRGEYVDSTDILDSVDDLLTVMPVINNDTINQATKTPFFKNLNNILIEKLNEINIVINNPTPAQINEFLTPYVNQGQFLHEVILYRNYVRIAHELQNIIYDNLLLEQSGVHNIFFEHGKTVVMVDNVEYTINELFNRVSSGIIKPDGTYRFNLIEPLASGVTPEFVSVDSVAQITKDLFVFGKKGQFNFIQRNRILQPRGMPVMESSPNNINFRTTSEGAYPTLLIEKFNSNSETLQGNLESERTLDANDLRTDAYNNRVDISTEHINSNSETLGLTTAPDGSVVAERFEVSKETIESVGYAEAGVMFIFAIITLILAWVYK